MNKSGTLEFKDQLVEVYVRIILFVHFWRMNNLIFHHYSFCFIIISRMALFIYSPNVHSWSASVTALGVATPRPRGCAAVGGVFWESTVVCNSVLIFDFHILIHHNYQFC